jgi:two-component system, LuxR family, response regulator FixJ
LGFCDFRPYVASPSGAPSIEADQGVLPGMGAGRGDCGKGDSPIFADTKIGTVPRVSAENPTVYVVDDDPELRESLKLMIGCMGLNVEAYASAEAFLDHYNESSNSPRCMVLDVRMPGLSGLGLQQMLASEGKGLPIIMISGCADIQMAVKAMRAGALDFLEKPISSATLSARIREAIDQHVRQQRVSSRKNELAKNVERLSLRQREVLDLLVNGDRSKQIARQLGIGEKTVAKHRASVLQKMQVDSVVELVRLFADANLTHGNGHVSVAQCN